MDRQGAAKKLAKDKQDDFGEMEEEGGEEGRGGGSDKTAKRRLAEKKLKKMFHGQFGGKLLQVSL